MNPKQLLLHAFSVVGSGGNVAARFLRGHATIFMLHRFQDPERGVEGHDTRALRSALAHFRRRRYDIIPLETLFERLGGHGPPLSGQLVFTIDDGYYDHAAIAGPIFAEFDCPVTTFVTTGFLDKALWFWWDRIEYIFRTTARTNLSVPIGGDDVRYNWKESGDSTPHLRDFTARCKQWDDAVKSAAIQDLARVAEVEVPDTAPDQYAPMSWADLRRAQRGGMSFGPHTVTHPVLSRTTDEQSRAELRHSWERLCSETAAAVPVFCYPNGQPEDFSRREIDTLRDLDFLGAVVGSPGYPSRDHFTATPEGRFRVARFNYGEHFPTVVQYASGLERLKQFVRPRAA